MITIITNTAHNKIGVLAERNPDPVISFSSQFQNGQGTDNRTVPFSSLEVEHDIAIQVDNAMATNKKKM